MSILDSMQDVPKRKQPKLPVSAIPNFKPKLAIVPPTVKLRPKIAVKAYAPVRIKGEQLSRAGEFVRLERAMQALQQQGNSKARLAELSKTAKVYAKSSSDITAKELLDFYARVLDQPDFGGMADNPNRTEQDERNIQVIKDIIYGLYKAITAYDDIIDRERKQGRL